MRPRFKGVLHGISTIVYILMLPTLINQIPSELKWWIGIYLFGVLGHLSSSAMLHLNQWSVSEEKFWRQVDHVMIFVNIAASYYAVVVTVIPHVNSIVLYFLNFGTIVGIIMRIFFTDLHPILIGTPYVIVGWAILMDWSIITYGFEHLPEAATLCLIVGLLYTIGAAIYICRWPNPYPQFIGFHEVFHVFTTIATGLLTFTIFNYCIPYYRR